VKTSVITIRDFVKGNKAYSLTTKKGKSTITEEYVQKVGRTYVTTGTGYSERRYENWDSEFLHEKVVYGESALLFKTKEDAEQYLEKCDLCVWLGNISVNKASSFSLEQLRRVKEILD